MPKIPFRNFSNIWRRGPLSAFITDRGEYCQAQLKLHLNLADASSIFNLSTPPTHLVNTATSFSTSTILNRGRVNLKSILCVYFICWSDFWSEDSTFNLLILLLIYYSLMNLPGFYLLINFWYVDLLINLLTFLVIDCILSVDQISNCLSLFYDVLIFYSCFWSNGLLF